MGTNIRSGHSFFAMKPSVAFQYVVSPLNDEWAYKNLLRADLAYRSVLRIYGLRTMQWSERLCQPVDGSEFKEWEHVADDSHRKVSPPNQVDTITPHWRRMHPSVVHNLV